MRFDARTPFFMSQRFPFLRNPKITLAALVLLGIVLRVIQLDVQPLWWDEGYSVYFATRDFADLLARTAVDIHPPLYYAVMQGWIAALGTDAIVLRALSVLIGAAALPLLYGVARTLFNPRVALASAFLLAIAPLHIYYSQELRMYGLVLLLGLASVALQLKILDAPFRLFRPSVTLYIVVTALILYTQYFAAFLVAAEIAVVLYLKFRARWKIELRDWVMVWTAIGALYLPWVIYAGPKLLAYVTSKVGIEQYSQLDPLTYTVQHLTAFSTGHVTAWTWIGWGAILFVLLGVLGIIAGSRWHVGHDNSQFVIVNLLAAIYLLVPLLLGFLVNLVYTFHPIRYERLLLFALPFFLMYVACGIVALWERERGVGILAAGALAAIAGVSLFDFYTIERYPQEDYRPLIQEMERIASANDLVYAVYPWQVGYLETYYRGAPLKVYEIDAAVWVTRPDVMNSELRTQREQNSRAWILAYQKQGRILEDRLTNEYSNDYVILDQNFGSTRVEYFAQGSETDFELTPIVFSPELTLRIQYASFEPQRQPILALARVSWNATTDAYSSSLRVVDAAGSKIVQQDVPLPGGNTTLRRALALPKNLPPGEYALQLVAYRRSDGSPLTQPNGTQTVSLATVTVAK